MDSFWMAIPSDSERKWRFLPFASCWSEPPCWPLWKRTFPASFARLQSNCAWVERQFAMFVRSCQCVRSLSSLSSSANLVVCEEIWCSSIRVVFALANCWFYSQRNASRSQRARQLVLSGGENAQLANTWERISQPHLSLSFAFSPTAPALSSLQSRFLVRSSSQESL